MQVSEWQHKKMVESYHDMLENKEVTSIQAETRKLYLIEIKRVTLIVFGKSKIKRVKKCQVLTASY